jgi:glycosyltransferase involved in cell wall biosynthesis
MKILLISTFESNGGAAIACKRLYEALKSEGADVKMLVGIKQSKDDSIRAIIDNYFKRFKHQFRFYTEKLFLLSKLKSKEDLFFFSNSAKGENISNHPWVKEADVINLHWFNHSFLSIENIQNLTFLNKKIVWTLHDMWAFTGGCHYTGECLKFQSQCGGCPYLSSPGENDISKRNWTQKNSLLEKSNIQFVTCSEWLCNIAMTSGLLKNKNVSAIPNPINTSLFFNKGKRKSRNNLNLPFDIKIVLFGVQNISDKRKGFKYLIEAVKLLSEKNIEVAVFGKCKEDLQQYFDVKIHILGKLNLEQVIDAYNAGDVYVLPSLEDNLPNTVMEAMACGTPVTAFNTGGIPEMINHKVNGYLAEYRSAKSLAEGIHWCLNNKVDTTKKITADYSYKKVSSKYLNLYKSLK